MTTVSQTQNQNEPIDRPLGARVVAGVIGGLAGGVVFGMLMAMMGMLPMIAGLVGSSSAGVGFLVHMGISAVIGAGFAFMPAMARPTIGSGLLWGVIYGAIWWVLGPLLIMPVMMGMGPQVHAAFTGPMLTSLMGHAIYGVVLGVVAVWWVKR